MNIANVVHQAIAPLWPLLRPGSFGVDIGSVTWLGIDGLHGACVDVQDRIPLHRYILSTASDHPAWRLAVEEPAELRYILVVDYESAQAGGGFAVALKIALHQQAHAIRAELANTGYFPQATRLMDIDHFLQVSAKETDGTGESWRVPRPLWPHPDDLGVCEDTPRSFNDYPGGEHLFPNWAADTDHCDSGHDLLFSLLLYRLEREATDKGSFERQIQLARAAVIPSGTKRRVLATKK